METMEDSRGYTREAQSPAENVEQQSSKRSYPDEAHIGVLNVKIKGIYTNLINKNLSIEKDPKKNHLSRWFF